MLFSHAPGAGRWTWSQASGVASCSCSHAPRTPATARNGQAPGELGVWSVIIARLRSAALAAKRCQEQGTRNVRSNQLQHRRRRKNLMKKPTNSQKGSVAVHSSQAQVPVVQVTSKLPRKLGPRQAQPRCVVLWQSTCLEGCVCVSSGRISVLFD